MLKRAAWVGVSLLSLVVSPAVWAAGVGDVAPEIRADRWYNTSGPVSLAQLRGQVVVVEFWATYCKPCHEVQPKLAQIHRKWSSQGVVLISMSDEPEAFVAPFIAKKPASYIISAGGDTPRQYGIRGIPAAFVIDRSGIITWKGNPHEGGFEDAIERTVLAGGISAHDEHADAPMPAPAARANSHSASHADVEPLEEISTGGSGSFNRPTAGNASSQRPFEGQAARPVKQAAVAKKKPQPVRKAGAAKKKAGKTSVQSSKAGGKSRKALASKKTSSKAKSAKLVKKKGKPARRPVKRPSGKRK